MGIVINGTEKYLQRTSNFPASPAFTIATWILLTNGAGFHAMIALENSTSAASQGIYFQVSDNVFFIGDESAGSSFSGSPSNGSWYFIYLRCDGSNISG